MQPISAMQVMPPTHLRCLTKLLHTQLSLNLQAVVLTSWFNFMDVTVLHTAMLHALNSSWSCFVFAYFEKNR